MNNDFDDLISRVDIKQFYEARIQVKGKPGKEIVGLCPFHDDKISSFAANATTGVFHCFGCEVSGSIFQFIEKLEGVSFKEAVDIVARFAGVPSPIHNSVKNSKEDIRPLIDSKLPDKYLENLLKAKEVLDWIQTKKGLSLQTIKKYKIGWNGKRNTIPIYDEKGILRNIRLYNRKKEPKIASFRTQKFAYGESRLYGLDELIEKPNELVMIAEGEWDKLLASQHGFLAVTGTTGAGTFKPEWKNYFKGKEVAITYDMDPGGRLGAENVARALTGIASSVKNVELPVKGTKTDKDISDYFLKHGASTKDLKKLIKETPIFKVELELAEEKTPKELKSFVQIDLTEYIDLRVRVPLTVSGETSEAFHGIFKFRVDYCQRQEKGNCNRCPRDRIFIITPGEKEFIESCMSSDTQVVGFLRHRICPFGQKPHLEILEKSTVREFFATQRTKRFFSQVGKVGIDERGSELVERKVYFVSDEFVRPQSYFATGYIRTHPKTQQVCLLATKLEPIEEEYESFVLNDETKKSLKEIQNIGPGELVKILSKEILYLRHRDELILAILLTYCSPLRIRFNQRDIRGWINTVIVGDSATGKCVHGDSLLFTNQGIKRIDTIGKFENDRFLPSPKKLKIASVYSLVEPTKTYASPVGKTIKIITRFGYSLEGTPNHPILVLDTNNKPYFKKLMDLDKNDLVAIHRGQNCFSKFSKSHKIEVPNYKGNLQKFSLEDFKNISRFLGYIVGDGAFGYRNTNAICFSNKNPEIIEDVQDIIMRMFGKKIKVIEDKRKGKETKIIAFSSKIVRKWLEKFGLKRVKGKSKSIPTGILELDRSNIKEFLRGLFETDGHISKRIASARIGICSTSQQLIKELQILLLNFGIMARIHSENASKYHYLALYGENVRIFIREIGFISSKKIGRAKQVKQWRQEKWQHKESINWNLSKEFKVLWQSYKAAHSKILVKMLNIGTIKAICQNQRRASEEILRKFLILMREFKETGTYKKLKYLSNLKIYWDKITNIEEGFCQTFDLTIPSNHIFFANGFINHNTASVSRFADFVAVGDIVSGLSASRTGITYGLREHAQKGWMIKIGRYPANSRKIVCIDEIQYIKERDVRTLGKAMDEGFLTIDRIAEKTLESMTRLIALANPKEDKVMDELMFGCEGLRDLFDKPIIRRFDLAICLTAGDIKSKELNLPNVEITSDKVSKKMLQDLIFWAWTRPSKLIKISKKTTEKILDCSTSLTERFGDASDVPLVSPGDFSDKLARIATAYATFCVSTDNKFEKIKVLPEHVEISARMIDFLYSGEGFGLKEYSEIARQKSQLTDYDEIKTALEEAKKNESHGMDLIAGEKSRTEKLLYAFKMHSEMRRKDIADFIDAEENAVKRKIQILSKFNLIDSGPRGYFKKPKFIKFLRRLARDEDSKIKI